MYRSVSEASAGSSANAFRMRSFAARTSGGLSFLNESVMYVLSPASSRIVGLTGVFGWSPRIATTSSSIVWYTVAGSTLGAVEAGAQAFAAGETEDPGELGLGLGGGVGLLGPQAAARARRVARRAGRRRAGRAWSATRRWSDIGGIVARA